MGIIRFALALIVVASHTGYSYQSIGALASVQAFFVLSGVYMAAVYTSKYSLRERGAIYFYYNRALRLWPTYIALLALTILVYWVFGATITNDSKLFNLFEYFKSQTSNNEKALIIYLSLFLIGQDVISVSESFHYLLPVRQSWSIASEMLFYSIVPLIFSRKPFVFYILSFLFFIVIKYLFLTHYGWRYSYFLPLGNFGYFILGCGLYHISSHPLIDQIKNKANSLKIHATYIILILLFFFGESSFERSNISHHLIFIFVFSICTIALFEKSSSKLDYIFGNISYGVYLNHFLILVLLSNLLETTARDGILLLLSVIACSVLLSLLMEKFIQRPIDRHRYRKTMEAKSSKI